MFTKRFGWFLQKMEETCGKNNPAAMVRAALPIYQPLLIFHWSEQLSAVRLWLGPTLRPLVAYFDGVVVVLARAANNSCIFLI